MDYGSPSLDYRHVGVDSSSHQNGILSYTDIGRHI